jgi:hypothetical protein
VFLLFLLMFLLNHKYFLLIMHRKLSVKAKKQFIKLVTLFAALLLSGNIALLSKIAEPTDLAEI